MNDDEPDRVDEVLREHGQAWADSFVEPKRQAFDVRTARPRSRSWLRPAAVAAAVLGVAAATVVVVVLVGRNPAPAPAAIDPGTLECGTDHDRSLRTQFLDARLQSRRPVDSDTLPDRGGSDDDRAQRQDPGTAQPDSAHQG